MILTYHLVLDGRDFSHGHRFTKPLFRAKVVVDGKQFLTKASADAVWNEEFSITFKANSHLGFEVICKHKKVQDDHTIGVVQTFDVLGMISKPDPGIVDVSLLQPGNKSGGSVRFTIEVIETDTRRREMASLSWRTLNSTDIIRRVIFDDDLDGLIPPQWACVISSLNVLVDSSQDLAELNSSAKVAVGAVCAVIKLINQQIERDQHVKSLVEAIASLYYHLQDTDFEKIKSFELTLRRLVYVTTECAYFIMSYTQKPFGRRIFEGAILGVDDIIAAFIQKFTELRIEFLMGSTLQSTHTVLQVLKEVKNIGKLIHLDHLPLMKNAMWKRMRTELTPEQEKLYEGLTMWAQNADERLVSVLVGDTREEASLIAHKLCERFYSQNRLGSGVFFPDATGNTEISCELIVSTIARDLAALHQAFAESIANVLAKKPRLVPSDDLSGQFEELLIHPLQSLTVTGPVLIVINGLDRCTDHLKFVEALSAPHILGKIPRNVRFLLAVGPQSQPLYPLICDAGSSLRIWHAGGDIRSHLIMNAAWVYISKDYQGSQLLDRLQDLEAKMAPVYSRAELEIPPGPYPITLTTASLFSEIRWVVTEERHATFLVPLLSQARQCVPPNLMAPFESYLCFVAIQASRWNKRFHTLFLELKDAVDPEIASWVQEIANTHHLDRIPLAFLELLPKEMSDYPKALPASLVLKYLNTTLRPNICQFEEITKLNKDIKDLDDRLRTHVPTTLRLLSGRWSEWVAPCLQTLREDHRRAALSELRTFLSSHLLSWIELISLLGCVDAGLKQLQSLEPALSQMMKETSAANNGIEYIHTIISDAIRFMFYFGTPIRDGGLFVHRLAFLAPTTTFIHQTYAPENVVKSGLDTNWRYKFSITNTITDWSAVGQVINPVLASLNNNSIKLWSLETGAHLLAFELPDKPITSNLTKFLALPSKNHFTFMAQGRVTVFEPDRSVKDLKQLELEGYASAICYTPDETSLAIRTERGHLYLMDLATSEVHTYHKFFPYHWRGKYANLAISPDNGQLATCTLESTFHTGYDYRIAVKVYNIASGLVVKTLEHIHWDIFNITEIIWSKDQSHMITIQQHSSSFCWLWDVEASKRQFKLDIGRNGSADFGDNGLVILALETEIRIIDRSTFEVVISIPLSFPKPGRQMVFGHHGLGMSHYTGGFVFNDVSVQSKSPRSFGTSIPLPRAYQENVFQNAVKHELRVQDLELINSWLVTKPDIKLVWIPFPFTKLVEDKSMDQITISSSSLLYGAENHLVLDCKAMEKYFL
ncbi:hypothetical protein BDN72DRAFT_505800 [Pluteus cervinus]|uniref:Uncharacterized protein n=1 Tax=Pluteus cervinus TaxID=181527 RepID=A0ACD3AYE9_9AGAR|nr:hypothetical protein BDN72DRAFT_505800 [Pluteus cervinus]